MSWRCSSHVIFIKSVKTIKMYEDCAVKDRRVSSYGSFYGSYYGILRVRMPVRPKSQKLKGSRHSPNRGVNGSGFY